MAQQPRSGLVAPPGAAAYRRESVLAELLRSMRKVIGERIHGSNAVPVFEREQLQRRRTVKCARLSYDALRRELPVLNEGLLRFCLDEYPPVSLDVDVFVDPVSLVLFGCPDPAPQPPWSDLRWLLVLNLLDGTQALSRVLSSGHAMRQMDERAILGQGNRGPGGTGSAQRRGEYLYKGCCGQPGKSRARGLVSWWRNSSQCDFFEVMAAPIPFEGRVGHCQPLGKTGLLLLCKKYCDQRADRGSREYWREQ